MEAVNTMFFEKVFWYDSTWEMKPRFTDFNQCYSCLDLSFNRRDGVVVRASASQSVDLGFISQVESYQKTFSKNIVFTASMLDAQQIGIVWRTSRQTCLLCPWARHLTKCLRLHVADRWWGQAVYPSWWPQSN